MSAEITPGLWTYGVRSDGSIWLSIGDPKGAPHYQGDLIATEADARLIVAAPKMLDALRETVLVLAHASAAHQVYDDAYRAVSEAIRLATEGEQKDYTRAAAADAMYEVLDQIVQHGMNPARMKDAKKVLAKADGDIQ